MKPLSVVAALALLLSPPAASADDPDLHPVVQQLVAEAEALAPSVRTDAARAFLAAAQHLPAPTARTLWRDTTTRRFLSPADADALDDAARGALERVDMPAETYYLTRYGSPVAYVRAFDLLGEAGVDDWQGRRVLDYGYGTVGHLRLLALCGAHAVGVDVDSFLPALYSEPSDQGAVPGADESGAEPAGSVSMIDGRWPSEPGVISAVGEGYDVFLSKNTLKRGYIHPSREADPRMLIDMGVDDTAMLAHMHRVLKPGGLALLYNLCPPEAADDAPYIPWADGRSPFTREAWEAAGFELLAFDQVDDDAARAMAFTLGWGAGLDAEEPSLYCWYTLARRLPEAAAAEAR